MLGEGREVFNLTVRAVRVDFPDANVVVTTSSGQAALAGGLEMGRVDRGVLVMPIDDERRGLHCVEGTADCAACVNVKEAQKSMGNRAWCIWRSGLLQSRVSCGAPGGNKRQEMIDLS